MSRKCFLNVSHGGRFESKFAQNHFPAEGISQYLPVFSRSNYLFKPNVISESLEQFWVSFRGLIDKAKNE